MTIPAVSVVMSVFNGEQYLAEAVESILGQSFDDFEFIVINDGSTDHSAAILESYMNKDTRLRVYHQDNKGIVEALNLGCAIARGKYIARTDADDIAIGDRLMRQVDYMNKNPEIGVLGGAVEIIDPTGRALETHVNPMDDKDIKSALLRGDCPFWHPSVLMRTNVFVETGGYRKIVNGAEDYDLWLRIGERHQLANLEAVVLKYRLHPGQVTVLKTRKNALSLLGAQAAAVARSNGQVDPLDSIGDLSPQVLAQIGVSNDALHAALVDRYLRSVGTMCKVGQYSVALDVVDEVFRASEWKHAENRAVADLRLMAATALWHQGKRAKSILNAGLAFRRRPLILGRPIKSLLRRFRRLCLDEVA
jgi:glycosyltransferase involved in cell wall biosynthesis